jgi:hypothetical protein
VYCEINHADAAAGKRAAEAAAKAAFAAVRPDESVPEVSSFTKDGELTQSQIDAL